MSDLQYSQPDQRVSKILASATGLVLASFILEAENMATFLLAVNGQYQAVRPVWFLVGLVALLASFWIARQGLEPAVSVAIGVFLGLFIEARFRGATVRQGTLDFFENSPASWFLPFALLSLAGVAVGLALHYTRPGRSSYSARGVFSVTVAGALIAAGSAALCQGMGAGGYSAFPPSRWLALSVLCVGLISAGAFFSRGDQ